MEIHRESAVSGQAVSGQAIKEPVVTKRKVCNKTFHFYIYLPLGM